jgi:hypothetical protein
VKLQKISEIRQTLPLTEFDFIEMYRANFLQSELGRIRQMLPLEELAKSIAKKMPKQKPQGNKHMFSLEGEIALMFLKSYTGMSDNRLIEMLNGNFYMQMFCGVLIEPNNTIKDGKIVSAIRNRLAQYLDIPELQKVLFNSWKGDMSNIDTCFSDATCYESYLRYPTDIKLLWEACEWLYALMKQTCHNLGERLPRNKFNDISKARLIYAKQRKPKRSSTQKMQRRLLSLLLKLRTQWNGIRKRFYYDIQLTDNQEHRLLAIKDVYKQQKELFEHKEVKHRIVSIDRPYIRPIVRGKENKRVEFGAKVNNIQIDGVSFIEHHSFEAFNEGVRVEQCIKYHKELTGVDVKKFGGDTIYANNASRKYCSEHGITTCFARKGPKPKDEDVDMSTARRILGNLRATVMEGSFGNQKQHYGVGRIAARNQFSEKLLLFFGIHMANAATLAERRRIAEAKKEATQLNQRRA